jgi:hypothetical protein
MKRKNREPLDITAPKKPRIDQEVGIRVGSTAVDGPSLNHSKSYVDRPQKFKANLQPSIVALSGKA